MNKRVRGAIAVGLMAGAPVAAGCNVEIHRTTNPVLNSIDRASSRYNLSAIGLLGLTGCESGFDPYASNGPYESYLQQGEQYWFKRWKNYNKANPNDQVPNDIHNSDSHYMVSGSMMTTIKSIRQNWECESKYRCYSNPEQQKCRPDLWKQMLKDAGAVAIGNRIVRIAPVPPTAPPTTTEAPTTTLPPAVLVVAGQPSPEAVQQEAAEFLSLFASDPVNA